MNFSQKFISSLLFTILLTSPLGSAVVLANTKAWVNPNCYENPLLDCDCTNDEKGKLIADKVSAGCVEIDTGTPLFVQKLASGVTQTPCTPTDTNTETCVRNPEVMWTPWNECSQRSQEAAAEREPSADEIATPVAGWEDFFDTLYGGMCDHAGVVSDVEWELRDMGNQAIRLWDYAWRASVPRDFIVQFKVFDVGATACYTEKIRYLLGLELDKDGEQSVDPNHPSRTYYINKIRELLLWPMDQRETLVAQGFTEIQDLLNQKICQTTNSQKEYSKICDTLVIDQIDNIMAQMVAQSPEYSIDVNDAVRGHLLSSDKKVEKEIVLSTMLRGQYLLDGAQMRFHTMDIDKRESILMDTYLALALLNGGVADLLVAASSETGNASTYFASQTFEIGFQKYEPDNEWIDCDKDLNTSLTYGYKNFYSPSCNCSDPGFKLFDEDMWAEEWNAMMEEIDAVQTTGFSFLNLFLWKEGDYQGDDFVERVWGYTKSVLYGTAYVLTLGFIDQWTKAEPEDYVCVYEDGVNGSCWESRVKDETKWLTEDNIIKPISKYDSRMFIGGDTKPLFNQMWDKAGRDANKELDRLGFYINPDLMSHTSRWEWFKDRISRIPISIQDRDGEVLINNNYVDHITDAYNYIDETIEDWFEDDMDTTSSSLTPEQQQIQDLEILMDLDSNYQPPELSEGDIITDDLAGYNINSVSQPKPVLAKNISINRVQEKATQTEKRNKMNVDLSHDFAVTAEKKIDYSTESMMIFAALANAATTINRAACDETHRDAISGSMGGYVASDDDLYRSPDALAQDLAREATVDYQNTQMIIAETNLEIQDLEAAYDQLESDYIKAKKDIESLSGDEKKEAVKTVLDLEREMTDIENKIAYAKQANTLQSKDYQARSSSYSTDSSFGSSQKHFNGQDPSKTYDSTLSRPSSDICRTLDKSIKKLQVKLR